MNWVIALAFALATAAAAAGCDQGNEDACKAAIDNVLKITGQENTETVDKAAFIRSCRAESSTKSIKCLTEAKTVEGLAKCEDQLPGTVKGMKEPEVKPAEGSQTEDGDAK